MESIQMILAALSTTIGMTSSGIAVGQWLVGYLRDQNRNRKANEVLQWLRNLGSVSDADLRSLVEHWLPARPVDQELREELALLLSNLVRTSRFHSTQGTPLSSYLRCDRLIEQLLANLQPKRRAGAPVSPGRPEWKVERFLGMGAFGEVWVGRNARFPARRAFKFFTTPEGKEWLKREAEALYHIKSRLEKHPNVIEYYDIVLDTEPFPFLMLEYVGGGSLEDWILTPPGDRRGINLVEVMAGIVRGLAEAHKNKIYHRDLKPANILLTDEADPDAKVADFGLSWVDAESTAGLSSAVSQAVVVGTRMYLPPEAADPYVTRSPAQDDMFAFGVVWYQALTGLIERPPYDFAERLHGGGVDSRTIRLLSRCLAHPSRRFQEAQELLMEMEDDPQAAGWVVPEGCFDVGPLVGEYLDSLAR